LTPKTVHADGRRETQLTGTIEQLWTSGKAAKKVEKRKEKTLHSTQNFVKRSWIKI